MKTVNPGDFPRFPIISHEQRPGQEPEGGVDKLASPRPPESLGIHFAPETVSMA